LFDGLDVARTPRLNRGRLPVGTLNFVKVHDADDLLGFVLNFLVVMGYKLGDDHAAASHEFFDCDVWFHVFSFGLLRDRDATTFAVGLSNDLSLGAPSTLDERERGAAHRLERRSSFARNCRHERKLSASRESVRSLGQQGHGTCPKLLTTALNLAADRAGA
jgi:hypothetical protein